MMSMETDEVATDELDEIRKKRSLDPSAIVEVKKEKSTFILFGKKTSGISLVYLCR